MYVISKINGVGVGNGRFYPNNRDYNLVVTDLNTLEQFNTTLSSILNFKVKGVIGVGRHTTGLLRVDVYDYNICNLFRYITVVERMKYKSYSFTPDIELSYDVHSEIESDYIVLEVLLRKPELLLENSEVIIDIGFVNEQDLSDFTYTFIKLSLKIKDFSRFKTNLAKSIILRDDVSMRGGFYAC